MAKFRATALFLALQNDDEDEVINQLNAGAEVMGKDADGKTFLHHAVEMKCKVGIIKELLKKVDIAERDEEGDTVLDKIVEKDDKDLDDVFIEFIDNIMYECDSNKLQELVLAGWEIPRPSSSKRKQMKEHSESIELLLENVKDFEDRVKDIHRAISDGNTRLLKQLVTKDTVKNARDEAGLYPLQKAIIYDQMETLKYLVEEHPEIINKKDSFGRTALHYAAVTTDSQDKYQLLVDAGADEEIEDNKELTPKYYLDNREEIDLVAFRQKHSQILSKPRKPFKSKSRPASKRSSRPGSKASEKVGSRVSSAGSDRQKTADSKRTAPPSGSVSLGGRVKTDPYLTRDIPPPKTEDGLYCAGVLGEALTLGLSEIVDKRPWDPVEFLGHWLQKYAANEARVKAARNQEELMRRQAIQEEQERLRKQRCEEERLKLQEEERERVKQEEEEKARQEEEEKRQREKSMLTSPPMPTLKEEEQEDDPAMKVDTINIRDGNGQTDLHRAVMEVAADVASFFVKGFNLGLRDANGKTPRDLAEEAGRTEHVEAIDKYVCGLFENGKKNDIMVLVLHGYTKIPNLTEKYGEDGTGLDEDAFDIWKNIDSAQETVAQSHKAVLKGSIRELRQNLSRKILSHGRDEVGRSLLHQAVLYNRQEIVEYLLENHPHLINFKDNHDKTPLHYATAVDVKLKELLVNAGADMAAFDNRQNPPSYYEENKHEILSQRVEVPEGQEEEGEQGDAQAPQETESGEVTDAKSEGQAEEGQAEEGQADGGQAEEGQAEGGQAEEGQTEQATQELD